MLPSNEDEYDLKKLPHKTYASPRIQTGHPDGPVRYASKVFDSDEHYMFDRGKDEVVLRTTAGGRQSVTAKFFEKGRDVFGLTIQKYTNETGRTHKSASLSFWGEQIPRLIEFLLHIKEMRFPDAGKINISDAELRRIVLSERQLNRIAVDDQETLIAIARSKVTKRDIVALAYRKAQLQRFRRLLTDRDYFNHAHQELRGLGKEHVWQAFFEANKWIFGYGLAHVALSGLDGRKLEQVVAGTSLASIGKRADAVLKTRGVINSLCFVEIKHHETELLKRQLYRAGTWSPSDELAGGIAQSHATVHAALKMIGDRLDVKIDGDPTGENLYGYDPRSFLVVGRLSEFATTNGVNDDKFRSFELFRRSVRRPEIITFDELYERAALIVAGDEEESKPIA
jgi:antiviral defense system Shedu protein SduA